MNTTERPLLNYPLISDQVDQTEIRIILSHLQRALELNPQGDIVEFGCYSGTTSLFLQRAVLQQVTPRKLHVYDSFSGLPPKTAKDESPAGMQFQAGELAVSKHTFIKNFRNANLPLPAIHKGWFHELNGNDIPKSISFAFLDGDYYESIMQSLRLIEERLELKAIIVVDDYQSEALPGVAKAVDEWLKNKNHTFHLQASLAVIQLGPRK